MKRGDESCANAPAQFLRRLVERPLLALGAHEPRRSPKHHNRRIAQVAAGAAAVLLHCVCSMLVNAEAQKVALESLGPWSTANLSEARWFLAATSLPNQGLAIFAGGQGTSCNIICDDCRGACGVRGMVEEGVGHACVGGVRCDERAVMTHFVQATVVFPKLWTSSMRSRETGALQTSARLDGFWPPHRCRIKDSRSSLVAVVRRAAVFAMIAGWLAV
jgi:hypothetical protein